MNFILRISILLLAFSSVAGQGQIIPLWDEETLQTKDGDSETHDYSRDILWIENVQIPTLEIFLPVKKNATGKGVVICPGGGYAGLAYDWEGTDIAKWLNSQGIAAFVLKYRLPDHDENASSTRVSLDDAQRAIRLVRLHAEKWNVAEDEIGIMGFSAGGHLASTAGTHFNKIVSESDDLHEISARPDYMILIYPVITMDSLHTHMGSRTRLIGASPGQELTDLYSNETQITEDTPPTFLVHSSDDEAVPVTNSLMFYKALVEKGISAEMHIYPKGGHGYALGIGGGHEQSWIQRLSEWFEFITP